MKLHFEPDLDYQHTAIEAVCDLFRGEETCRTEFTVSRICTQPGIARRRQTATTAWQFIGLLGLTEAAEPLPPRLLVLRECHRR